MNEKIMGNCQNLENENNINNLFAVANGSRPWRIRSEDSDYDIRFVFVRPIEEYVRIERPKEVINIAFDKEGNQCESEGSFIDISGFDIFKFVTLLSSSNPTTIEWLVTDIVYCGEQNKALKEFALKNFSRVALYYHYRSLCRNNYQKYIVRSKDISHKRYLHIFRGLVNAKWVVHKKTIPPISFVEALEEMKDLIPNSIVEKLHEIIDLKSQGREKDKVQNISEMDEYVKTFLEDETEAPTDKPRVKLDKLNAELRRIVLSQ